MSKGLGLAAGGVTASASSADGVTGSQPALQEAAFPKPTEQIPAYQGAVLSDRVMDLVEEAWQTRGRHFPSAIEFDYPEQTAVVSTTGAACSLDCAHCGGHFLADMIPIAEFTRKPGGVPKSCLISGGCDRNGKVPFLRHEGVLAELKGGSRLNFHVGLVDEAEAEKLGRLADAVSFDFVADDETIREVFGIKKTSEDYLRTYRSLRRHAKVLPHLCIGLKGGEIAGEYRGLDLLEGEGVDGLVLIVFFPVPGTRYADRQPPPLEDVVEFMARARLRFPDQPIFLGCMRPRGRYRAALDSYAVRCGVQKIVQPAPDARRLAETLGLEVSAGDECCVL